MALKIIWNKTLTSNLTKYSGIYIYGLKINLSNEDNIGDRKGKGKGLPQQADVAQGVQDMLRPLIFLKFSTTRVVDRQPYAPVAFTPEEIPGIHF
jgi:hypothetical protein